MAAAADYWLDYVGADGRKTVKYDVPDQGARGSGSAVRFDSFLQTGHQ